MRIKSLALSLGMAAVVAIGISLVWGFAVFWAAETIDQTLLPPRDGERLQIRLDGEPVIVRSVLNSNLQEIRTLGGEQLSGNMYDAVRVSYLSPPERSFNARTRLAGANDQRTPATYWYLLHDGQTNGHAYGIGYHSVTKRVVGYFARDGFTSELPPRDQWFQIMAGPGLDYRATNVMNAEPIATVRENLHVLANDQLWEIDVRQQTVKSLAPAPSTATLGTVVLTLAKVPTDVQELSLTDSARFQQGKLALYTGDSLTIFDQSNNTATLPLPERIQNQILACVELASGGYLLITQSDMSRFLDSAQSQHQQLLWLSPVGEVLREQEVVLHTQESAMQSPEAMSWLVAAAFPATLGSLLSTAALALTPPIRDDRSPVAAMISALAIVWPPLVATLFVGLGTATATYRRHRFYGLDHVWYWTAFAFVFGLPGWLAYRFHRAWPAMSACPSCGEVSPRNRDNCIDCGVPFPPPPLKGLEIYA